MEENIDTLDSGGKVKLKPDLTWWEGSECIFVGDAKYKRIENESIPNADLYQLLAYTTALDLPGGLLIYAQGEAETATYTVRNSGKRLDVVALDLRGSLDAVLKRVDFLADKIRALRDEAQEASSRCVSCLEAVFYPVSFRPKPVMGTRTRSSGWMIPCWTSCARPAKAADEVGSP